MHHFVRFEVLMVAKMLMLVFWVAATWGLVGRYPYFWETHSLRLQILMFPQNGDIYQQGHILLQLRKTTLTCMALPGGTEEKHKNFSQDSWSPCQDLNLGPPECANHSTQRSIRKAKDWTRVLLCCKTQATLYLFNSQWIKIIKNKVILFLSIEISTMFKNFNFTRLSELMQQILLPEQNVDP
jgi:hypothetical protein